MWQLWENPTSAYPNSSQKLVASDETIVDAVNGYGAEHNMIDFADKNHEFLSSLYVSKTYFTTSTEMGEENICMKYKKDGTLLVCKTTTCQLMAHENYLGAPAQLVAEDPNSSQKMVASDKTIVDAVNGYGAEHNNMIDFANKHHEFLSSFSPARCSIVSPRKVNKSFSTKEAFFLALRYSNVAFVLRER
ncbi:uncharacterized protein G2W53_041851 [Senna tora]|uniref:Uncharacterized protein n=1 Tax=Senna tora TaxID=362788 RepID=A0A834SHR8_9FABA|nr:uncharacterized protein G2W53_041851 [Senna tora]